MQESRANKYEFEALKLLSHLVAELMMQTGQLATRATVSGQTEALDKLLEDGMAVLGALCETLPMHQRKMLQRHVSDMKITFSSPVAVSRDEAYSYVPRETILRLIQSAAADKCPLCLCGPEDKARCDFAKAVNELRLDNAADDVLGCTVRLLAGGTD